METKRRQQLLLGALVVVLAVIGYRALSSPSPSPAARPASNERAAAGGRRTTAPPPEQAPAVHLDALDVERPGPGSGARDLFRFKPKAVPPPPKPVAPPPTAASAAPSGPPPPPPPPPIPYKFIGTVEQGGAAKRLAVLSDGRGVPVYGREGDIIEGRYRIVRIGAESIEMEHIDGRGRQTIRLTGS